jgi:hypothetical protein
LKYGLVSYRELADGTMSIKTFWKAQKQAEFMEWVEQQSNAGKEQTDDVRYFD